MLAEIFKVGQKAHIPLKQGTLVTTLSLKIFKDILSHLHTLFVHEMEFVLLPLASAPQVPPVGLKVHLFPPLHLLLMYGYLGLLSLS